MPNIELINRIKKYICQDPSRTHSTFKNDFPVNSEEISSSYFSVIKTALKKKGYKIEGMTVKTKKKPEQKVQKKETDSGSHRFVPGVTVKIPEKINTGSQIFLENPAREALKKSREDLETARAGYVESCRLMKKTENLFWKNVYRFVPILRNYDFNLDPDTGIVTFLGEKE